MKPRLIKGVQFEYVAAVFDGTNKSGIHPVGKRVLVMTDNAPDQTMGGVHLPQDITERQSLAAESGVLVAVGGAAFSRHYDGTPWTEQKPEVGTRVYIEKYSGQLIRGDDGKSYRVMDDSCIGAIFDK